jgi:hypothetical protein
MRRKGAADMTRILCIEDSDDNLYMLHRRLSRAGFDVKVARNGAQGVEWAKTSQPDLIVMDLNLPGLNGWGDAPPEGSAGERSIFRSSCLPSKPRGKAATMRSPRAATIFN